VAENPLLRARGPGRTQEATMTLSLSSPPFPPNGDIPRNTPATARISPLPSSGEGRLRARRASRSSLTIPTHPTPKRRRRPGCTGGCTTSSRRRLRSRKLPPRRTFRPGRARVWTIGNAPGAAAERAMQGHILAKAELVGTYQRGK